ncbi:hypothetical protein SKAU_G00238790 [Synaphobranchus kaupii]|uniref:Uncharacterized protein n=1 Tax=Synaphobranchus kaupii TaxID=118154 RepID=A0A9Q1IS05_SYNKA|nr:hypothetical protein SKAU_G00238790 [Synaphobranchus kaupii]
MLQDTLCPLGCHESGPRWTGERSMSPRPRYQTLFRLQDRSRQPVCIPAELELFPAAMARFTHPLPLLHAPSPPGGRPSAPRKKNRHVRGTEQTPFKREVGERRGRRGSDSSVSGAFIDLHSSPPPLDVDSVNPNERPAGSCGGAPRPGPSPGPAHSPPQDTVNGCLHPPRP